MVFDWLLGSGRTALISADQSSVARKITSLREGDMLSGIHAKKTLVVDGRSIAAMGVLVFILMFSSLKI